MTKKSTKGFTLIELLVVISIIALLIGILLPALGEAKRRAQQLQDVANLGEHGKAIAIYASENRDRMPNIPEGTGGAYGEPGNPASIWATRVNPTSPDSPDGGSSGAHNGWAFANGGLSHSDIWRFYHLAFGDYIVEGEGFELLSDVFASPRSGVGSNYDIIKEGNDPDLQPFETAFASLINSQSQIGIFHAAQYGPAQDGNFMFALQGSYRYTLAGLYGQPVVQNFGLNTFRSFWEPFSSTGNNAALNLPWKDFAKWENWRGYITTSSFVDPSSKVAFWEFFAVNSRRTGLYFMPNAEVAVGMVDGHAKLVRPFDVMPNQQESSDAFKRGSYWGTQQHYLPPSGHGSEGTVPGLVGPFTKPFAWFIMTDQGPRGRDLARTTVGGG